MVSSVCHFLEVLLQASTPRRRSQQSRFRRYRQIPGANSTRLKVSRRGATARVSSFRSKQDGSSIPRRGPALDTQLLHGPGTKKEIPDDVRIQFREFDIAHEQGRSEKQSLAGFQRAKKVRAVNVSQAGRAPVPSRRDAAGKHRNGGPRRDVCDLAPQIRGNSESDSSK